MILTCPSCGTQYVVKDGAIPPGGRQVRCAACKHSWHQDPEEGSEAAATAPQHEPEPTPVRESAPAEEPQAPPQQETAETDIAFQDEPEPAAGAEQEEESFAEAALIEPRSGPEAEQRAFEEASIEAAAAEPAAPASEAGGTYAHSQFDMTASEAAPAEDWREPPQAEAQDDEFTPFPAAEDEEPKARSPLLTVLVIVLVVIAVAAAFWFLAPPDLKAKLGVGAVGATPLALVTTHMDRQRLQSGNELLTVTGRVINPTTKEQNVPPLQAELKTSAGKVVYSWTIDPPTRTLPPGASASFNSAEVNVPPGGEELTITLGSKVG